MRKRNGKREKNKMDRDGDKERIRTKTDKERALNQ